MPDSSDYLFDSLIEDNFTSFDVAKPLCNESNLSSSSNFQVNSLLNSSLDINIDEKIEYNKKESSETTSEIPLIKASVDNADKDNHSSKLSPNSPSTITTSLNRSSELMKPTTVYSSPIMEIENTELILKSIDSMNPPSPKNDDLDSLQEWECDMCYFKNHVLSPVCEICSNVQPTHIDLNPKIQDVHSIKTVQNFENKVSYVESNLLTLKNSKNNFYELNNKKLSTSSQPVSSAVVIEKLVALTAAFLEEENQNLSAESRKEMRNSETVTEDMISEVKELLSLFGIPYVEAPGEAEAQCAELFKLGLVDGIVTDDCDVFLFGGGVIYKNIFEDSKFVEKYDSKDIYKELGLDRKKFIDLAQLLGSDYTVGVKYLYLNYFVL